MITNYAKDIVAIVFRWVNSRLVRRTGEGRRINNILVSQIFNIGDVVLTTPALEDLRETFPGARITFLISQNNRIIVVSNPNIDRIVGFHSNRSHGIAGVLAIFRAYLELRGGNFDLSIHFDRDAKPVILALLLGINERIGFKLKDGAGRDSGYRFEFLLTKSMCDSDTLEIHRSEGCRKLGQLVGSRCETYRYPKVCIREEDRKFANEFFLKNQVGAKHTTILIHPGASLEAKRWPIANFEMMAQMLLVRPGRKVIFCFGPQESSLSKESFGSFVGNNIIILTGCSMLEYAAVAGKANLFVGNDSGPMHIAAAMGTPCIISFVPEDARLLAPYWVRNTCLKSGADIGRDGGDLRASVTVEDMVKACEDMLSIPTK